MQVTKETLMGELLRADINTANILMAAGMHCVGCPVFPDGISGRGLCCTRHQLRAACKCPERVLCAEKRVVLCHKKAADSYSGSLLHIFLFMLRSLPKLPGCSASRSPHNARHNRPRPPGSWRSRVPYSERRLQVRLKESSSELSFFNTR